MIDPSDKKTAILVASFGTSYGGSRSVTIGAIESTVAECFPGCEVRRAFTSNTIRRILKNRDGVLVDSVPEALNRLAAEGFENVIVQPTHFMPGIEYDIIKSDISLFAGRFKNLRIGRTLLETEADVEEFMDILCGIAAPWRDGSTAMVFMGHGTDHSANELYERLQKAADKRANDIFIGTVEATPGIADILKAVKKTAAKRVVLSPLMIVAGDHATNDMAGDDDNSWKNVFKDAGYEVVCRITGLGSEYGVQKMIAGHCRQAML